MAHRLFSISTATSLLLIAFWGFLWHHSQTTGSQITYTHTGYSLSLYAGPGLQVMFATSAPWGNGPDYQSWEFGDAQPWTLFLFSTKPGVLRILGFCFGSYGSAPHYYQVGFPYWFLMLLSLAPTAYRWHRLSRGHRPGRCANCGYDLRAHLAGGAGERCPECGASLVRPEGSGSSIGVSHDRGHESL